MTVTSGFFNGVDRATNATDISAIFDGLISDGIYDTIGSAFAVTAAGGNYLNLGTGRAWFNHTWTRNDAVVVYEAPASELLLSRYDCMVLEVDHSDPVRNNRIFILSGTPSSNPELPELSAGPYKFQYILASILRAPNSTEIAAIDITPYQGTAQTPFVNGLLEKFDIQTILTQYQERSLLLLDNLEQQLLVLQETGVPIHNSTHYYGSSDALSPGNIGQYGVAALISGGKINPNQANSVIVVATNSRNLALTDLGTLIQAGNDSTPIVLTIPKDTFTIGAEIEIVMWGTKTVTINCATNVSMWSMDVGLSVSRNIAGRFGVVTLKLMSANVWLLAGALA